VPIAVYLQPGANALAVAALGARDAGAQSPSASRSGLRYDIPFDTTRFVEVSIEEVAITFVGDPAGRAGGGSCLQSVRG